MAKKEKSLKKVLSKQLEKAIDIFEINIGRELDIKEKNAFAYGWYKGINTFKITYSLSSYIDRS